jgi:phosphoglycolate phosphatase
LIKFIVFDFDGVIVDSRSLTLSIVQKLRPGTTKEEWKALSNGSLNNTVSDAGASVWQVVKYFWLYNSQINKIAPVDGLADLLKELDKKYSLCVVSFSMALSIKRYLRKYGLLKYFDTVLGTESGKDKTRRFQKLCRETSLECSEIVFVTDTVGDILESRELGIRTVAVTWGIHSRAELEKMNPDCVVDSMSDLKKYLLGFAKEGAQ